MIKNKTVSKPVEVMYIVCDKCGIELESNLDGKNPGFGNNFKCAFKGCDAHICGEHSISLAYNDKVCRKHAHSIPLPQNILSDLLEEIDLYDFNRLCGANVEDYIIVISHLNDSEFDCRIESTLTDLTTEMLSIYSDEDIDVEDVEECRVYHLKKLYAVELSIKLVPQ